MRPEVAILAAVESLEGVGVPYMVVGSLASNVFGIPRSTQDADLVIDLAGASIANIVRSLPEGFELDPQMSLETITATRRYLVTLEGDEFTIEFFLLSDDDHDQERFGRRIQRMIAGRAVWMMTPEDVVITKLRWSKLGKRNKDVDDARNVIATQGNALDWDYISRWCDRHGTLSLLDRVRKSIPEIP